MRSVIVDNYIIDTPIIDILHRIQISVTNGKLKDIKYNEGNDHITVTCPVHNGGRENKPAASIYIGDNSDIPMGFYNCFVCGSKGPFYKFVAECFDWSEDKAKEWLKINYGKQISAKTLLGGPIRLNKTQKTTFVDTKDFDSYQSWCPYLAQRGISRATCTKFNVKYDPENRQVVFPCYDEFGHLVMFARRSIDSKTFFMDKNVEKPLFGLDKILKNGYTKAIICEGPFDCLTANEYGFPAMATLGSPSIEQIKKLSNSGIRSLYIMFDNDEGGRKFTEFLKKHIDKKILTTVVKIPNGKKDINDLTKDEFDLAIKNAEKNGYIILNNRK
jgi:DNA primase